MKRLLLLVTMLSSFSLFAAPWDLKVPKVNVQKWTQPFKAAFDEPILTDYTVSEQFSPQHRIAIYYKFNKTASYTMMMTVMVYGYWADINDYEPRTHDIYIPPGQLQNTWYYPLASGDDLHPEFYDIYYLGPDPGEG